MPVLSRWFIRTALIYLILGVTLGSLLLADKVLGFSGSLWGLLPLHIEWLLLGWTLQLAMGIAWWILPRPSPRLQRTGWAWSSYALLNGGLGLSAVARLVPFSLSGQLQLLSWIFFMTTLMQVASVGFYALALWPRVGFAPLMVLQKRG
jgi:hypothetical protein